MPKYTNSFRNPKYREESIVDPDGNLIGIVRLKPSSILWKPRGARQYYAVNLQSFAEWITSAEIHARRTKS